MENKILEYLEEVHGKWVDYLEAFEVFVKDLEESRTEKIQELGENFKEDDIVTFTEDLTFKYTIALQGLNKLFEKFSNVYNIAVDLCGEDKIGENIIEDATKRGANEYNTNHSIYVPVDGKLQERKKGEIERQIKEYKSSEYYKQIKEQLK